MINTSRFAAISGVSILSFFAPALVPAAQAVDTILAERFPIGQTVELIGGFSADTPKDPGERLFSSIRFEGDWLVSCEVSTGRMVQYANFVEGSRMGIKGKVVKHTTFGMELEKGCELSLTETQ